MKYTLEIQKLLLQAQNDNLHPREKANLLKEAVRIADENEDIQWAVEMRLDLIYELNLLSADAEEIAVFSKILDNYENPYFAQWLFIAYILSPVVCGIH